MSSNTSSPNDRGGVYILDITLTSTKPLKSVVLRIETPTNTGGSVIHREERTAETLRVTFVPPRDTPLAIESTVHIEYPRPYLLNRFKKNINIKAADLLRAYRQDGDKDQAWTKSYGSAKIIVRLANHSGDAPTFALDAGNQLRSTTDDIRRICPRFRILVLGKSGVGKSSLINKAFGVTDAQVSDEMRGDADIDREILSNDNPFFVLHDSRGFEGGETATLGLVQNFIKRRGENLEIKAKLHAVWVCVEIPTKGGRLLETGVEEFLKSGAGGHLGKVPIIVIFTKLDAVVAEEKIAITKEKSHAAIKDNNEREAAIVEEAKRRVKIIVERDCIAPLKDLVGTDVPYVAVSTNTLYSNTLTQLIDVTFKRVTGYIREAGIISGISQKVNPQVKILTSIEVGKRNYWKGLASETVPGMTMEKFLEVIHVDIVKVWNLDDEHNYLTCSEFKKMMLRTVPNADKREPNQTIVTGPNILGAVESIVTFLAGPVGPIVLHVTTAAAEWIDNANRQTHDNLRRMMIYIVSLTIVMQNLFWTQSILATKLNIGDEGASNRVSAPITRRLVIFAWNLYCRAPDRESLLTDIRNYTDNVKFLTQRSDATVEKLTHFLRTSTINNEDGFKQQKGIKEIHKSWVDGDDEPWPSAH
ncbi:hypothetical protein BDZ94DRAFT_1259203 [Collybia nuda]|uniref:G domain-containing protein n=1 Tax=Collybia nuda TaxID=64659 RepID=A0A9P6CK06_9AGAR|nr:hypothetical protein BDZ94DRAFT_1259203 [Collybia nuda]